jgi:hypothetical protein
VSGIEMLQQFIVPATVSENILSHAFTRLYTFKHESAPEKLMVNFEYYVELTSALLARQGLNRILLPIWMVPSSLTIPSISSKASWRRRLVSELAEAKITSSLARTSWKSPASQRYVLVEQKTLPATQQASKLFMIWRATPGTVFKAVFALS